MTLALTFAAAGCRKASKPTGAPATQAAAIEQLPVPERSGVTEVTRPAQVADSAPAAAPAQTAATAPATSQASPPLTVVEHIDAGKGITVSRLSNGLRVIVKPFQAAPVVSVKCYVHAGGLYEGRWLGAGLSHLTEHLVAEDATHDGAAPKGGDQTASANRVTAIGGQSNASTSLAWTQYYIEASASRANDCIDLVADWMARPDITQDAFDREHGVVQRELEMGLDDPDRQLYQAHMAAVYRDHPAAVPVIGYKAPLQRLTSDDVREYIRRMYVPQNMVFCVVGDIDPADVLRRVCEAFAGFRHGNSPRHDLPNVQPFAGVRRSVLTNKDLKQTLQMLSFQSIPLLHEDLHALDVLSYVLTEGQSSRLVRRLRDTQIVTSVSSFSWTPAWGAGQFTFSLRCEAAKANAAETALLAELKKISAEGVTDEELARAKRQKIADYVFSQQTASSIADTLASDLMFTGDVSFSRHYTDRIQSVTAEQVRQMARKYFTMDTMVITRIVPQAAPAETTATAPATQAGGRGKTEVFRLPDGTDVILQHVDVELVSMAYVTYGGLLAETDATNGLGTLMTDLTTRGADRRSTQDAARFFDAAGGSVSGNCGSNTLYWQAAVLDEQFPEALDVLADIILRPTFPDKELQTLRPLALDAIRRQDEDYQTQLGKYWRAKFFAAGPYGRTTAGREPVIANASVEQIRHYHRRHVLETPGVLAIYGNFDPAKTRKTVEAAFLRTRTKAAPATRPAASRKTVNPAGEHFVLKTTNEVAGVIVAVPGMTMFNEDRFAITVLDTLISGYRLPSGWLHNELRGKRLVYAVHAVNWAGIEPGAFLVEATCQGQKVPEVVDIIRKNLARATTHDFSPAQVEEAVNVILTAVMLDSQSMSDLAIDAALNQLYGFGYDYRGKLEGLYRKVTPADVKRVARKYLNRPQVVVVTTPRPQVLNWPAAVVEQPGAAAPKTK